MLVTPEDDLSDGGVGECANPHGGDCCAKTDFCQHTHELFCRKVDVHAEEVVSWVFFARLCKGRPTHVQHVEVSKYATHWSVRPCRGWWRKEWCREICWEVRPWHLDRLPNAIALHHQGECRCALVSATALHCERVADIRPQASHRIMLKTRRDRKSTRLNSSHLGISYAVF